MDLSRDLAVVFENVMLEPVGRLAFSGEYWPFLGWLLLFFVSMVTVVGWALVAAAWMRWIYRNVNIGGDRLVFWVRAGRSYGGALYLRWCASSLSPCRGWPFGTSNGLSGVLRSNVHPHSWGRGLLGYHKPLARTPILQG
jgi:hypothetical protein